MRVQSISNLVLNQNTAKLSATTKTLSSPVQTNPDIQDLKTVSANQFLSQMPNVSFRGPVEDDLIAYELYNGPQPPSIEQEKYTITVKVKKDIEEGKYLSAIAGKIALAKICHKQGKERDAYMLELGIKSLYKEISDKIDRDTAKIIIGHYNSEMAEYLDEE